MKLNHIGLVIGNVTHYSNRDEIIKSLEAKVEAKDQENQFLKEKITLLETTITDLRNTVAVLQQKL
jgi:prefoldin subunit 5